MEKRQEFFSSSCCDFQANTHTHGSYTHTHTHGSYTHTHTHRSYTHTPTHTHTHTEQSLWGERYRSLNSTNATVCKRPHTVLYEGNIYKHTHIQCLQSSSRNLKILYMHRRT